MVILACESEEERRKIRRKKVRKQGKKKGKERETGWVRRGKKRKRNTVILVCESDERGRGKKEEKKGRI